MRLPVGRGQHRDEEGAGAILTAILMIVLVLFVAIVVDLGNARDVRRQSQNAADASSLAAANMLYPATGACTLDAAEPCIKDAEAAAKSYALKNFQVSDWSTCTVPAGSAPGMVPSAGTPCILFDNATNPTLVRVVMPTRQVPSFFGGIKGFSPISVGSTAQAKLGTSCSLCFLGSVDVGNGDLKVTGGGSIAVNGTASGGSGSIWSAQSIGVVTGSGGGGAAFTPSTTTIAPFGDPLAGLTMPSTGGLTVKSDPCADGPGLYNSPVSLPKSTCNMGPGLYVISSTWTAQNKTLLTGTGVTLYVTSPGALDFKNGDVGFSAPTPGTATYGAVDGYAIIYDRTNTNNLGLQGNGGTNITGTVYAPASNLDLNGNSCFGFNGGPVVVKGVVKLNGTKSCITVSNALSTTLTFLHLNR